ncbi:MAG: L-fuculose-phosphate aldolase [Rhodospirillaceae bacterium]|nr:L-fuculose-phosphate aldolase [Rhodospirillaceae bacterium]MYB15018.1 L-fuculose-phosphate aldolase [Rhodospirillaceae bacterium]MYI48099.1 L-fuculose-phosphate aldolase [Rhodospirillaceae bacterium]
MAGLRHLKLRKAVIAAARQLEPLGINRGTSGNVSVRAGEGLLITPTGIPYDALTPAQIVWMDSDGRYDGDWLPSSEWRFHCDILRSRPDLHAVVHTHAVHATALACHGRGIPAFHYMVAAAGGPDIRCAPYATFGTAELSANALHALEGRRACLLAHHGLIACGHTLEAALALAVEVETLAATYLKTLEIGEPEALDATEMQRILGKFATYGQNPGRERR